MHAFLTKLLEPGNVDQAPALRDWYPLPGGRLELRNTGFYIARCGQPRCTPFHLHDPAGRRVADGHLLQPMKQYAEQCARDLEEFEP